MDSFHRAVATARQQPGLYFSALLDEQLIGKAFGSASLLWQGWIYTPAVTIWVFLSQCLSPDHSCREAVSRLVAWRVAQGRRRCSPDTSAYCTARDALPESVTSSRPSGTNRHQFGVRKGCPGAPADRTCTSPLRGSTRCTFFKPRLHA